MDDLKTKMTPLTIDDDDPQQCFVYEENILLEALKNESNILSGNLLIKIIDIIIIN